MMDPSVNTLIFQSVSGILAGCALGTVHFLTLSWNVNKFASGQVLVAMLMQLVRFAGLGLALYGLARWGVLPLVSATAGLALVRWWVLRYTGTV